MRHLLLVTIVLTTLGLPSAYAHHSFSAGYDDTKKITLDGSVVLFMIRNPHSFLQVLVKNEKGGTDRWQIEWAAGAQLDRERVTRETLKPGDRVIVTADQSRTPEDHRGRMRTIERPSDGWKWGGTFD